MNAPSTSLSTCTGQVNVFATGKSCNASADTAERQRVHARLSLENAHLSVHVLKEAVKGAAKGAVGSRVDSQAPSGHLRRHAVSVQLFLEPGARTTYHTGRALALTLFWRCCTYALLQLQVAVRVVRPVRPIEQAGIASVLCSSKAIARGDNVSRLFRGSLGSCSVILPSWQR